MDQVNGTTSPKKKQVLFSIGSYSERDRRVINKISTNGLFNSATTDDVAPLRPQPTRTLPKTRPMSLNFLESTPKYKTLPARHRYIDELNVEKPACPPSSACNSPAIEDGPIAGKPAFPPKIVDRSLSLEPEQLRYSGRVALTIAAYEGEPRTPTRLDFLPSGRVSRASSKASSDTASTPTEDIDSAGSRMMLQNELVATLKRSNLKKLTEDDVFQENGAPSSPLEKSKVAEEPKITIPIEEPESNKPTEELESNKPTEELEKNKTTEEPVKVTPMEEPEKIQPIEEPENKTEIKEEIAAALTELENSTQEILKAESESIPPPPAAPMPEPEKPIIKEEQKPQKTELENGELEAVELPKDESVKESKDEIDETPNGSVKQLAVELGKKMTFKADIETVPGQNGIKDE